RIGCEERPIPRHALVELQNVHIRLLLFLLKPQTHPVEAQGGGCCNHSTVATTRVIAMSMGDPGRAARVGAIEPKINLRQVDAGLVKFHLHVRSQSPINKAQRRSMNVLTSLSWAVVPLTMIENASQPWSFVSI